MIDLEHTAPVIATHYEGTDSRAYFVSTARDGSVHVTCMEIKKSNIFVKGLNQVPGDVTSDGTVVTASICVKFTLTQPDDGNSLAYGTSVFMSTKGNPGLKGRTLFIGDNNGVLHQHNSDKGLFVSNLTINSLGLPISSIAKSRVQLMVASGTTIRSFSCPIVFFCLSLSLSVLFFHFLFRFNFSLFHLSLTYSMVSPIPKMKIGNYECYGPKENIIQILTDVKNPAMLYAKLENGAVVVFHTRYKEAVETTSFNPLLVFSRRNKKDVNVCRIFRTIASIKDNIKENLQAGSLSVTKNYIITAEKDYLTVFPTVIASQPNQGIHSLADITFESELANRMKLKFQDFLAKMKKTEIVVSNFDKGFSGIRIDSNTGVNPKPKQVGIFSMLAPAKVIPEKEPFFLVGFNSLFPSSEISEARSSIFIYQFKTQEREHKKSNGTGWMDLLSKGPIALVMIGALYLFKTKFSKKRDRDAGNKRGGKGGNYKGFGSRSFQKGVETRFGKGLESNFESKIVSSSVAAKEEHHEVPDNTPRDTSDYQEIDSSSFSIQELSDKLESLNAIQLEGQIVDEKDIHFEG